VAKRKKAETPSEPALGEETRASSAALNADALGEKLQNWADQPDSKAYERAAGLYDKLVRCYENKQEQMDSCEEFWAIYNAKLDENQQYVGNSSSYVPEVRNCINARAKRTIKQLFPNNRKHVDAIGAEGKEPTAVLSMLEHYIRQTNLKDVVKSDLIAGDVTGQWNVYVDWFKRRRSIKKVIRQPMMLNISEGVDLEDPDETEERIVEEDVVHEGPEVVAFATEDLAVYPPTVDDVEKSIASCIRLRLSLDACLEMQEDGIFLDDIDFKGLFDNKEPADKSKEKKNPPKKRVEDAGIRTQGTNKYLLVFWAHTNLPLDGEGKKQPAFVYYYGQNEIAGIIRNPLWSGKRPVISAPIEKQTGSFFGISEVEPVKYMQWNLNDFFNMGQDSAQYGLLPVILTDPLQNPNWASMVMGLAAVWPVDPNKTKALEFPQLWKDSAAMCQMLQGLIREAMGVNDAMMGRPPPGRKNSQQVAAQMQEQASTISDHAERYEEAILNPLVERFFELDQQFRTEDLTVITKGEIGIRAKMTKIEPQQFDERYYFWWAGTSFTVGMQRMQQQIAWMNVLRGIPPQLLNGRRLDVTPILESGTEAIFGPEIAPHILIDTRDLMQVDPEQENQMLFNGFDVPVHPEDDDPKHLQSHQQDAIRTGDPAGHYRKHISEHMAQLQAKRQAQMAQQAQAAGQLPMGKQPGGPGAPGGAGPGVAGQPRPGAQPGMPRQQGPAGMIPQDQMLDPMAAGRG
jgi:hypothetical protein